MKLKISGLFLVAALLFVSCGSATQSGEGSITLDAGKVARYLGRSITASQVVNSSINFSISETDYKSLVSYGMIIKVSTSGDYSESVEKQYTKKLDECETEEEISAAMEEFYGNASGSPVTIEGIPIGSRIRVNVKLTFGEILDEETFRKIMRENGLPESYIETALESMRKQVEESQISIDGSSELFVVKSGVNRITIRVNGDAGFGFDNEDDDGNINIVLYTKISGANSGNGLFVYTMIDDQLSNGNQYINGDFVDFGTTNDGYVYYIVKESSRNYLYRVNPQTEPTPYYVTNNITSNSPGIYVEESKDVVFFGALDENYYYIEDWPLSIPALTINRVVKDTNGDNYEFCWDGDEDIDPENGVQEFSNIFDFAVKLGEKTETENNGLKTVVYNDSAIYMAALLRTGDEWSGYTCNIGIIKLPMTYTINQISTSEIDTTMIMDNENLSFIYLSNAGVTLPYDGYSSNYYTVTDMYVTGNELYVLVSSNTMMPTEEGPVESYPYDFPVYSFGSIVKVNLSNFSNSGVTQYGCPGITEIQMPQIDQYDGTETGNIINFQIRQPVSEFANTLFNPRKFIAVKPKELVIADDGIIYYKDNNDFCYRNIDRMVVFSKRTSELKAYTLNTSEVIQFEKNDTSDITFSIQGTGYAPGAPCQYRP